MNTLKNSSPWTRTVLCVAVLVLTVIAAGPLFGQPKMKAKPNQGTEPPLELTLEYNGKTVPVTMDKPFEVRVGDKTVSMKLTSKPYRVFQAAGVRFKYPAHHGFDYDDSDPGLAIWTLNGNSNIIMVMLFTDSDKDVVRSTTVKQLTETHGRADVKTTDVSLRLAGRTLHGTRVDDGGDGISIWQDVFTLDHKKRTLLLLIQDTPNDDGTPSRRTLQAKKLLQESFEFTE